MAEGLAGKGRCWKNPPCGHKGDLEHCVGREQLDREREKSCMYVCMYVWRELTVGVKRRDEEMKK